MKTLVGGPIPSSLVVPTATSCIISILCRLNHIHSITNHHQFVCSEPNGNDQNEKRTMFWHWNYFCINERKWNNLLTLIKIRQNMCRNEIRKYRFIKTDQFSSLICFNETLLQSTLCDLKSITTIPSFDSHSRFQSSFSISIFCMRWRKTYSWMRLMKFPGFVGCETQSHNNAPNATFYH